MFTVHSGCYCYRVARQKKKKKKKTEQLATYSLYGMTRNRLVCIYFILLLLLLLAILVDSLEQRTSQSAVVSKSL